MLRILIAVAIITPFSWNQKVQAVEETIASVQAVNSSKPMMYIDNPVNNSTISNKNSFAINGWAVNSSGIKEVKIYVQDNFVGNATIGISRPDVNSVYPQYKNSDKSGFNYTMSTVSLSPGITDIKVQAIGNDGTTQENTVKVNLSKFAPRMYIDTPLSNSNLSDSAKITGWAVNASGIKEVKVYVQDNFIGNATLGVLRPDVKQVYPEYIDSDRSGYEYVLNTSNFVEGTKKIKVQAIGNDGTIQESVRDVVLKKLQPIMAIDGPKNNLKVNDNIQINGWSLNASGVKEVKIYVDGNYVGNATTGGLRPDVKQVYPLYKDSDKSGYNYTLNTQNISPGSKVVKIQSIGNDGSIQESSVTINVEKLKPLIVIDAPKYDSRARSNIDINGWALNASGVKEVKIYIDGNYVGNAVVGGSRLDVKQVYTEYANADKSGYNYSLDTSNMSNGRKAIKIQAIGNDGSIQEISTSIIFEKLIPIMFVDEPKDNSSVKNNITVKGWALNPKGIKQVKIYIDGNYSGDAMTGLIRPDVKQVYSEYINADKSGYEYTIDTITIPSGLRNIKVQAIGNDGSIQEYYTKVNISKPSPKTYIDKPISNSTLNNSLDIGGWALNASGVKQIKVYLDNNYLGDAKIGILRPDVRQVYPEYINAFESGFQYLINTELVSQGTKTIKVQVIGNDGSEDIISFNIIINHSTTTYINYSKSFDSYIDIQMEKKPLIQDKYTLLWRYATRDEVAYYMNPLNFINDSSGKYMFLKLNYTEGLQASQLNSVLKGKGVLEGKGEAFIEAGRRANINPIYLVAHALLETGNGTSTLARGAIKVDKIHDEFGNENSQLKSVEPKTIYNMYGIGALDKDANLWGSEKAYSEGWFTVEDAIIGGAKWIGSGYINSATYNQNTIYKMRWDFSTSSMWHQYATDVAWAYKQTSRIRSIVESMDDPIIHFEIPRFN